MTTRFVILSAPRSGSTLLARTLNSVDGICCHGEILAPNRVLGYQDGFVSAQATAEEITQRSRRLMEERDRDPDIFVQTALDKPLTACGFKIMYDNMLLAKLACVFDSIVRSSNSVFIHLVRRNAIRRYVSEQIMQQGGPIHSLIGGKSKTRVKIRFDQQHFESRCAELAEDRYSALEKIKSGRVVEVVYEDLLKDFGLSIESLCKELGVGVAAKSVIPALEKVGADDLRDVVDNFEELMEYATSRGLAAEVSG